MINNTIQVFYALRIKGSDNFLYSRKQLVYSVGSCVWTKAEADRAFSQIWGDVHGFEDGAAGFFGGAGAAG